MTDVMIVGGGFSEEAIRALAAKIGHAQPLCDACLGHDALGFSGTWPHQLTILEMDMTYVDRVRSGAIDDSVWRIIGRWLGALPVGPVAFAVGLVRLRNVIADPDPSGCFYDDFAVARTNDLTRFLEDRPKLGEIRSLRTRGGPDPESRLGQ